MEFQQIASLMVVQDSGSSGKRTAAPNETSGRNPNTPIRLYDTHPNQRFAVYDEVVPLDPDETDWKGTVLGHVAEDRLLVQWQDVVTQVDASEVVRTREWKFGDDKERDGSLDSARSAAVEIVPIIPQRGGSRIASLFLELDQEVDRTAAGFTMR